MSRNFHALQVAKTDYQIDGEAKTVTFDIPQHLKKTFSWRPGQHITLRFLLNDEEVRRSYSISSSPSIGEPLRITVKRLKGGLVSNHINNNITSGEIIEVMPPFGNFCLDSESSKRRTHYFFGAGSGITPLYSMICSVLTGEPHSYAHLVYGNKTENTIIFKNEFKELENKYPNRFSIAHILSKPSIWSGFSPWRKGTIDQTAIEATITENPPYAQDAHYYICGPGAMNQTVKAALLGLDVPLGRIHMESYGSDIDMDNSVQGVNATMHVSLEGENHQVPIDAGQTLLEAMRAAGLNPTFSCQAGVCGACRAQLKNGTVHMRARMALGNSEIENGATLTCQAVPTSSEIIIEFG